MKIGPQLKLAACMVALVISTVFVADFLELLPRPEEQAREHRRVLGETLAVQLSTSIARGSTDVARETIRELVGRNDDVVYAVIERKDGTALARYGQEQSGSSKGEASSLNDLRIPIFEGRQRWGEVRIQFQALEDWGLRLIGMPQDTLLFLLFLAGSCLFSFYLLLLKAMTALNPSKVVPKRVNAAFDTLSEGVLVVDEQHRILLANRAFANHFGTEPANLLGHNPGEYSWDLSGNEQEALPWQIALERGESIKSMPLRFLDGGTSRTFTVNASPIDDGNGKSLGALVTFDDVTPLEAKNEQLAEMLSELGETQIIIEQKNRELEQLANFDALSGQLNRRAFMERYSQHFASAAEQGADLCALMVDIDHFKRVNDNYGHAMGDQVIRLVAEVLGDQFKDVGTVGRYGGEEFAVVLPGALLPEAQQLAERARAAISALVKAHSLPMPELTASIGIAARDAQIKTEHELLELADRALYQAKETGRNQSCTYDDGYQRDNPAPVSEPAAPQADEALIESLKSRVSRMNTIIQSQAAEITHQSMHDSLTGLPNRYLFLDRVTQGIKLSVRNDNLAAVVSVSLSAYEYANDNGGGDAAEQILKQASDRLERVVRAVDSIGVAFNEQELTLSRIAFNELALLIVDLDAVDSVPKIASRITQALEAPFLVNGSEIVNQVHCGIAVYPNDSDDAEVLIRNASLARSYAQKRSPKASGNAYFSSDLDARAIKNTRIAAELRQAIDNDGLRVVYQPKINAHTGQVSGVEALARWEHPELGNIGPMEFIAVAEQIGVIDRLTDWIVARVCRDVSHTGIEGIRVSVNVSPQELCDPATARRILSIIRSGKARPEQIEVEITESSMLDNFELARSILNELRDAGVQVALDDFGTAYSSLNLLLEMPVDVIKIDRSFVKDIQYAPGNQAVVQAILHMAQSMDKQVVAEGVENELERDCLVRMGCRDIQGYLFAKPMPLADLTSYIERKGIYRADQDVDLLHLVL
jgi:diguanylate cyclase (GGDEF)-like protein/PAS domain S-box-containing protein